MSLKEIANLLLDVQRPLDIFGDVDEEQLKKIYKSYVKKCHPDIVKEEQKDLAERTIKLLNELYKKALQEMQDGTYNITDEKELLKHQPIMFEFDVKGKHYAFYRSLYSEDVADVYLGLCEDELVTMKIASDENDNTLMDNEFKTLTHLKHLSLPQVLTRLKINGRDAIIFKKGPEITLEELKKEYGNLNQYHICWVLERMLSAVGYLHSEHLIHGNIKPENILIDVANHNVIIKDYTLCVDKANDASSHYKIINDDYTPSYVSKDARIKPNVDIYAVGKVAINLLGGDVSSVALPLNCDIRIRTFIRKLLKPDENDAWKLWDELIKLREDVFGTKKFQTLEKKKVRRN